MVFKKVEQTRRFRRLSLLHRCRDCSDVPRRKAGHSSYVKSGHRDHLLTHRKRQLEPCLDRRHDRYVPLDMVPVREQKLFGPHSRPDQMADWRGDRPSTDTCIAALEEDRHTDERHWTIAASLV